MPKTVGQRSHKEGLNFEDHQNLKVCKHLRGVQFRDDS